jgi:hypothetical protein
MPFYFCVCLGGRGVGGEKNDQRYNEWILFFDSVNMQYLCRCHGESTVLPHKGLSKINQSDLNVHVYMLAFVDLICEL